MAERVSSALRLRDRPAKGDEKLLEISAKRGTTFAVTLPPFPFFPPLRLIKLASRSLRIGRLSEGRRGKGKKKKRRRNVSSRAPLNGTARTNCVIGSTRRQWHVYLQRRGDVDLWRVSIIDPSIHSIYDDRKEVYLLERIERNRKLQRRPPDRSEENILIIQSRLLLILIL